MRDINLTMERSSLTKLIEQFRECKTSAEEREFINTQRANIRTKIKDLNPSEKAEAILKLIWMNMLGFETEFSQIECMNALFNDNFKLKTVGYLGLTLFLSEESQVLMMATNRIRIDLENTSNDFLPALALRTFSEIADTAMVHDLASNVKKLLRSESKFIRKKAMLAAIRILKKDPNFVDELKDLLPSLLLEQNQGLLICSLHLAREVLRVKPGAHVHFVRSLDNLYAVLKGLTSKFAGNYNINGVNDPFLQCAIIDFLKIMAQQDESLIPEFAAQALAMYNGVQANSSSTAKCILYQVAKSIMQVSSTHALKKVAISILGSFLELRNKNYLFASLNMLYFASNKYKEEVSKFDKIIQKCATEKDFTTKKLAISVLKNIAGASNSSEILELIIAQIQTEDNRAHLKELLAIAFTLIEKNSPSIPAYIDGCIGVLSVVKGDAREMFLETFFNLVANRQDIQGYLAINSTVLLSRKQVADKELLIKACMWSVGEFYGFLIRAFGRRTRHQYWN